MPSVMGYWRKYRAARGPARELVTLALCLVLGLVVIPTGIWFVGRSMLGPYAHGGWPALMGDYFLGLGQLSTAFWTIALGPYVAVWCLRLMRRAWRR